MWLAILGTYICLRGSSVVGSGPLRELSPLLVLTKEEVNA